MRPTFPTAIVLGAAAALVVIHTTMQALAQGQASPSALPDPKEKCKGDSNTPSETVSLGSAEPGRIVAIAGEPLPQPIGTFKICQGFTIKSLGGVVDFGDGNRKAITPGEFQTRDNGKVLVDQTYVTAGTKYPVAAWMYATCTDVQKGDWYNRSCGFGTAQVYNPASGITGISISPASVVGGNNAVASFTLTTRAPKGGTLVRVASSSQFATVSPPYVVIQENVSNGSFTIRTAKVNGSTSVTIELTSGAATASAVLTITP